MSQQLKHQLWNLLFVAIILSMAAGLYVSTTKIDYTWNWHRLPQYIIYSGSDDIYAPFDGTASISESSITIESDSGDEPFVVSEFSNSDVSDGDLIFAGDTIASVDFTKPGPLLIGLYITLKISVISIFFAIIIGIVGGIARISSNPVFKKLTITYVELIRGTPLLVQIFIAYYFLGTVFHLDRMTCGIAALSTFAGAYLTEIVRAGIQSIHKGQMEAARSLGMNYFQAMIYVILPQALKRTLPPMAGQFISLIKDSSLVSVIAITDLTKAGREVVASNLSVFEVWFTVAIMYLLLTGALSFGVQYMERRLAESD